MLTATTEVLIRIKKERDGSTILSCHRADGSSTWQRQTRADAMFFPLHDLTHYAVETVLNHRRGFYGLVADGWNFPDFGSPWPRGPLPPDADASELLVGFLDAERAAGAEWSIEELNGYAARYLESHGLTVKLQIDDSQLYRIRARMRELFDQWHAVAPGDVLELRWSCR